MSDCWVVVNKEGEPQATNWRGSMPFYTRRHNALKGLAFVRRRDEDAKLVKINILQGYIVYEEA